jgi:hypothetical protein
MKNLLLTLAFLAAVVAVPAFAQSSANLYANVPNEFFINGQAMPAGEYEVAQALGSQMATVRSVDRKTTAMVVTWGAKATEGDASLSFRVVNGTYYLIGFTDNGVVKEISTKSVPGGGILASIKALPKR